MTSVLLARTTDGRVPVGELKAAAAKASRVGERTVAGRLAELIAHRAMFQRGQGPGTAYKSSGLL